MKNTKTNIGKGYLRSKTHQDAGKTVKRSEDMKKWKEADWVRRGNQRPLRAGSTETQVLKKVRSKYLGFEDQHILPLNCS